MASLHSWTIPPCSAPIHRTGAAAAQLLLRHVVLRGALCAATEFRLDQDENIIVLNSGVTVITASRSNPSLSEVYARDSGNHTSGLLYLSSQGLLRTMLRIYPLAQSEWQFTPWDNSGTELQFSYCPNYVSLQLHAQPRLLPARTGPGTCLAGTPAHCAGAMRCSPSLWPITTTPTHRGPPGASLEQQRASPRMCSGGKADISPVRERELLQNRLSPQSFIYNESPLLAAGWGTGSCWCCPREGTWCRPAWGTTASSPALPARGSASSSSQASGWNTAGIGTEHRRSPSPARGPTELGWAPWLVLECGGASHCFGCVSTAVDPSSPFLQWKIAFWWNMSMKEGNAFTKNEGFMESSKG